MTPPNAPSGEPRKTLVEMFVEYQRPFQLGTAPVRYYEMAARLREADVALDEARICADADGVRIRELVADRDREAVNREAVQRALADVVVERDALAERYKGARVLLSDCIAEIERRKDGLVLEDATKATLLRDLIANSIGFPERGEGDALEDQSPEDRARVDALWKEFEKKNNARD